MPIRLHLATEQEPSEMLDVSRILGEIVRATANATGEDFFPVLVRTLAQSLGTKYSFVADYVPEQAGMEVQTRAFWAGDALTQNVKTPVAGTPCDAVAGGSVCFHGEEVLELFPEGKVLAALEVQSYLGVPIFSRDGKVLGHLVVMDDKPMEADPQREWIIQLFAERAAGEMERLDRDAQLREQAAIIESTSDSVVIVDLDLNIVGWNKRAEDLYGYTEDEVIGKSVGIFIPDRQLGDYEADVDTLSKGDPLDLARVARLRKDGTRIWVSMVAFPLRNDAGEITRYVGISRDVTSQVEQDEAIRRSEERLRTLFETMPGAIRVIDREGIVTYANAALGSVDPVELIGRSILDFVAEDTREDIWRAIQKVFRTGEAETRQLDGHFSGRRYSGRLVPIGKGENPKELLLVATDITDALHREKELQASEEMLRSLFEAVPDVIRVVTPEGIIKYANRSVSDTPVVKLIGQNIADRLPEYSREEAREALRRVGESGESVSLEFVDRALGTGIRIRAVPIMSGDTVHEVLVVTTDISETVQKESALRESELMLRGLFDNVPDYIRVVTPDGIVKYANRGLPGIDLDRLIGSDLFKYLPEDIRAATAATFQRVVQTGQPETTDMVALLPGVHYRVRSVPVKTGDTVREILLVITDMTQEIERERALRDSEGRLRSLFEAVPDLIRVMDMNGIVIYANRRSRAKSMEELVGSPYAEIVRPEDRERFEQFMEQVASTGETVHFELKGLISGIMYEVQLVPLTSQGRVTEVLYMGRDITERLHQEEALRSAEERYRLLAERMNDFIWIAGADLRYVYVSPSVEAMLGYRPDELLGRSGEYTMTEAAWRPLLELHRQTVEDNVNELTFEVEMHSKSGEAVLLESSVVVIRNEKGEITGYQGISRDITARHKAEEALKEREEQYRLIVETSHEGICLMDSKLKVVFANRRSAEMMGYPLSDMAGLDARGFMFEEDLDSVWNLIDELVSGQAATFEYRFRHRDGHAIWTEVAASLITTDSGEFQGVLGMFTDISDRKAAEEQRRELEAKVQHAQKLESLGVLAGGIAHDFNNLLAGIMGYASLLEQDLEPDDRRYDYVQKIGLASARAAELTKQMLAYSGRGKFVLSDVNLTRQVREMIDLISASISKKARVNYDFDENPNFVRGDSAQIGQVIMNLIINASDALEDEAGRIDVQTSVLDVDEAMLSRSVLHDPLPEGRYAVLEVSDSGAGMDEETIGRIFDPFFTTKFTGRGLGLAAVLGIVRGHRGAILVESELGKGTTVTVLWPVSETAPDSDSVVEADGAAAERRFKGVALVVDDDPIVRRLAQEILERTGLDVITAGDGGEALVCFREEAPGIDFVLLDLTMPEMGGHEVFNELRKISPEVPVIISSGYAEQDVLSQFGDATNLSFVQKPYRRMELMDKIAEVFDSDRTQAPK